MVFADITGDDLFHIVADAGHIAQGMDHWACTDLSLLSASAFRYLALMLRLMESGKPWPAQILLTCPEEPLNPMEYRFLMITSSIYRLWGKTRLRHLKPWIDRWRLPNMYGGLQGVGADDAWYATSLEVEHAMLYNSPIHRWSAPLLISRSVLIRLSVGYYTPCFVLLGCLLRFWSHTCVLWNTLLSIIALAMLTVSGTSIGVEYRKVAHFP